MIVKSDFISLKPKVGLFLITGGWIREVGLQNSSSSLSDEADLIAETININLSEFADISFSGVIYSEELARQAVINAKKYDVEVLLISPLMWAEDILLKTVLKEFSKIPLIFVTFLPYTAFKDFMSFEEMIKGCGVVGSLQMSGFLRREGYFYEPVVGYYKDRGVYEEIKKNIMAIKVSENLKNLKVGVLPFRCDQMTVTYVDEFDMHKLYGIELKYLELQAVKDVAQSFSKDEIENFKSLLLAQGLVIEVDERNLNEGIKYSLALEKIIKDSSLKVLAMNDVIEEMHNCFGMRPCLVNPRLSEYGVNVSMEADIAAGIAMHILNLYTNIVPFYTEILCADLENNTFIMGHAGYYNYANSDPDYPVKVVSDPEYKTVDRFTGACIYYKYKPGPITIINSIYDGSRLKWTAIEGESLAGPPILEGDPHVHCKLEKPLKKFFKETIKSGVSQHWIVVYGHIADDLKILCEWNNINYIRLSDSQELNI
jgi:L-arabinose isomerase